MPEARATPETSLTAPAPEGPGPVGPLLMLDDIRDGRLHLAALFLSRGDAPPPPVETAEGAAPARLLSRWPGVTVWRARFALPCAPASYRWNGETFDVAGNLSGDLRIAFVSCNGEEHGDLSRDATERNAMWARLCDDHRRAPFALLLHGGDQVYADEATDGHPLTPDWPARFDRAPAPADLQDLRHHLRARFAERYLRLAQTPEVAWLSARVPSLMQWDDHDICDGWGSLKPSRMDSAVGRTLFAVAREAALTFQHAAADGDLPPRFADPSGRHLGWAIHAPGLRLLAPDLRSERTRRQVMGSGWDWIEAESAALPPDRTLILSTVPLLGPRLSLLELLMVVIPSMQKYEDDLRDQWQSRAHRESWRRMLRLAMAMGRGGGGVTALSGEIHLATRATMRIASGHDLHQLVASGISHRAPPKAWARILGGLASLGESPLPGHPIRIRRIPGQPTRYVAARNYLTLDRTGGRWAASWALEGAPPSPPLPI